jgi:hypothetical protein
VPVPPVAGVDLAPGKSATQSTTNFNGAATRAVDGKTDGVYNNGSVTHTDAQVQPWWQVDLGSSATVDTVRLWNRTDCCSDRLWGATVFVSPTDPTGRSLAQLQADTTVKAFLVGSFTDPQLTIAAGGITGRYVRVQLTSTSTQYLSLAEVQVFGTAVTVPPVTGVNIAAGKSATQYATDFGGVPSRAVDGNTDGVYNNGSVTHTNAVVQPWWQVDLGALSTIDTIRLWNRTDCCTDRLSNATVLVSSTDPTGRSLPDLKADLNVTSFPVTTLTGPQLTIAAGGITGRYVRVELNSTTSQYLSLAEVQVFGSPVPTTTPVSLAAGRAATVSSSLENAVWSKAYLTDGATTSTAAAVGWTSVDNLFADHPEAVSVDLGAVVNVASVVMWPRTDGTSTGYGIPVNYTVETSTDGVSWTSAAAVSGTPLQTAGGAQTSSFTAVPARFVRVTGTSLRANPNDGGRYRMQLAELQVFAS